MSDLIITERDLVIKFRDARKKKDEAKKAATKAQLEFDTVSNALIEALHAQDKTSSAKYEGIGYCGLVKPRLYASFDKDNEAAIFEYLRSVDRDDLIKPTVNAQSLSTFVKERVEKGEKLPEVIKYHIQESARFYEPK